ncbi:MAG: hypothetical protein B7733_23420 [Myxococcales bacterium FL481]|nr:MAG: hypothetical protein B7733_23420 [Myxococcales bacterium FL481]
MTLVEESRFLTAPSFKNPSRTSVNLNGDAAVANRSGGITKYWAVEERCSDTNGTPGIQTSTGRDDVLEWDDEECRAWHTPMDCASQRPIAWTRGTAEEDVHGNVTYVDQKLWTTCITWDLDAVDVHYMNGDTGEVERTIEVPYADLTAPGLNGGVKQFTAYGGAVDAGDHFWFHPIGDEGRLVRVDANDFTYKTWEKPYRDGYGIAVDGNGRVWSCGSGEIDRFDPDTETWERTGVLSTIGGCMADAEDRLWASGRGDRTVVAIDINTLEQVAEWTIESMAKGISIDFEGYVWAIGYGYLGGGNEDAFKIDPDTGEYETYGGLDGPYTYSDMTGFALANAGILPVE